VGILLLPPLPVFQEAVVAIGTAREHVVPVTLSVQRVLALLCLMSWWWVGEVVPLPVTALLPALVGPLLSLVRLHEGELQAMPLRSFVQGYADPIVLLFLGSFILAEALREYGIDRRWALLLLSRRWVTRSPRRLVLSIMVATAVTSMWMNNTATAAMLMPVVVGIFNRLQRYPTKAPLQRLGMALALGVAWASSIGGMMTVVGTAPNGIAVGVLRQQGIEVSFLRWLQYGIPVGMVLLIIGWLVLVARIHLPWQELRAVRGYIVEEYRQLPPLDAAAWRVLLVVGSVVSAWLFVPFLALWFPVLRGVDVWNIALAGGIALFLIPASQRRGALLSWQAAQRIDWGTLLLFGGGLSLSGLLVESKAAVVLTHVLTAEAVHIPPLLAMALLLLAGNFATELISNTALASLLLALIVPFLKALGIPVEPAIIALAMVTSCAFMLPVATPPNAIAYATRLFSLPAMMRVGIWMNLLATFVLVGLVQLAWAVR